MKPTTSSQIEKQHTDAPIEAQGIPLNGYQQVIDMLKIADPAFRESLLKRLAQRDLELANSLRKNLSHLDV